MHYWGLEHSNGSTFSTSVLLAHVPLKSFRITRQQSSQAGLKELDFALHMGMKSAEITQLHSF